MQLNIMNERSTIKIYDDKSINDYFTFDFTF